ncbi:MAG: serine protease [Deltaproteobacteria bacterium]|nr:MAG: serine protease [Deltaproteobacteria bacterium]
MTNRAAMAVSSRKRRTSFMTPSNGLRPGLERAPCWSWREAGRRKGGVRKLTTLPTRPQTAAVCSKAMPAPLKPTGRSGNSPPSVGPFQSRGAMVSCPPTSPTSRPPASLRLAPQKTARRPRMTRFVRASALALGVVTLVAASGCPGTMNWTQSTVAIQAEGIGMQGDKVGRVSWVATGFWIDEHLLATNAHVATRALELVGVDDDGNKYHFDKIMALDREGDIAILHADRAGDKPGVEFLERPARPKDLRGHRVMLVGNSGGLGLGFFNGEITNILGEDGEEQILHNSTVVGGSSGSALYDKDAQKVVGIHHSGADQLKTRIATASWHLQDVVEQARKNEGVELKELFTLPNIAKFANIWGQREFCLAPGESFKISFNVPRATDILGFIKPTNPETVLVTGLVRGDSEILWKAAFKGAVYLPFSLQGSGPHNMIVAAPADAPEKTCGVIGAGEIAWEKGIK